MPSEIATLAEQAEADLSARGFALLRQAGAEGFRQRQTLQAAQQAFQAALRQNPYAVLAYVGLASLLALSGNHALASELCDRAHELDPSCRDARQLRYNLQSTDPQGRNQLELVALDYDQLHDQTEAAIRQAMRLLLQAPLPLNHSFAQPLLIPEDLARLQRSQRLLQGTQARIARRLEILGQELDVTALQQQLMLFERGQRRQRDYIDASHAFQALAGEIRQGIASVNSCLLALSRDGAVSKPEVESFLEAMMDRCDLAADQLDAFAERYDIAELKPLYKRWLLTIEDLQERLDGLG